MARTNLYRALAGQAATKRGVDPSIYRALIGRESGWNPTAGSPAGAEGLAQIHMPSHPDVSLAQAQDPNFALNWGAGYLGSQLRRFKSYPLALAAYNAGPGAVESGKWRSYPETTSYVRNVMADARNLYGYGGGAAPSRTPLPALSGAGAAGAPPASGDGKIGPPSSVLANRMAATSDTGEQFAMNLLGNLLTNRERRLTPDALISSLDTTAPATSGDGYLGDLSRILTTPEAKPVTRGRRMEEPAAAQPTVAANVPPVTGPAQPIGTPSDYFANIPNKAVNSPIYEPQAPEQMLDAIATAQKLGLAVRENPYVDPVQPEEHVGDTFHTMSYGGEYGGKPLGRAADISGPPDKMAAFANWALQKYGNRLTQLFYDPFGGQRGSVRYGQPLGHTIGGHSDHVHIAF